MASTKGANITNENLVSELPRVRFLLQDAWEIGKENSQSRHRRGCSMWRATVARNSAAGDLREALMVALHTAQRQNGEAYKVLPLARVAYVAKLLFAEHWYFESGFHYAVVGGQHKVYHCFLALLVVTGVKRLTLSTSEEDKEMLKQLTKAQEKRTLYQWAKLTGYDKVVPRDCFEQESESWVVPKNFKPPNSTKKIWHAIMHEQKVSLSDLFDFLDHIQPTEPPKEPPRNLYSPKKVYRPRWDRSVCRHEDLWVGLAQLRSLLTDLKVLPEPEPEPTPAVKAPVHKHKKPKGPRPELVVEDDQDDYYL